MLLHKLLKSLFIPSVLILFACNNVKSKSIVQNATPPFDKYPFTLSTLDKDMQSLIKNFEFYTTSPEMERIIAEKGLTDANSHLCWAYFEWIDIEVTREEAEIMQRGETTLAIVDDILKKDPTHEQTLKFKGDVEKEVSEARVVVNKKMEDFYKTPIEKLTHEQAADFIYLLTNFKTDKNSLEITYKISMRLYNEGVDKYFNLRVAAKALWSLQKYEEARPMLWQIINWKDNEDVQLYHLPNLCFSIYTLALEAIEQKNTVEFIKLIKLLKAKYQEINTNNTSLKKEEKIPVMPENISGQLLSFALEINDKETLEYIVNSLFTEKYNVVKDKTIKENIAKAKSAIQ